MGMLKRYKGRIFESRDKMVEILLQEANMVILRIDTGELCNTVQNRYQAVHRLDKVESIYRGDPSFNENKDLFISLHHCMDRLMNMKDNEQPFLLEKLNRLMKQSDVV